MRVVEPTNHEYIDTSTTIVLLNHFGSTVSEDTGRDAQALADTFSVPVIAVNRPGTAGYFPRRQLAHHLSSPTGYIAEMAQIGERIDRKCETLGLSTSVVTGRSAGGLGALALARSETVSSLGYLFVVEPIACEAVPVSVGFKRFARYNKSQRQLLNQSSEDQIVHPLPTGLPRGESIARAAHIVPALLFDRLHNQRIFTSTAALGYAAQIAEYQPQIDTTLVFAEHSLVATPEIYDEEVVPIADLRTSGKPFVIKQEGHSVHASFDNRQFMSGIIRSVITRAIAQK